MDKSAHPLVIKLYRRRRWLPRAVTFSLFAVLVAASAIAPTILATDAAAQTSVDPAPVDLELVLAVDVSLSMDLDEQRLQRDGYVAAFRDGEIHKAVVSGMHGRIAVTYVEWAGPSSQNVVIGWTVIDGANAAHAFADKLEATPISRARLTSISSALRFAHELFGASGVKSMRRVVDVSGDGPNNAGEPVVPVRDELVAGGIVINGLPIMLQTAVATTFDISDLDQYYGNCVIGGTGAFMVPVKDLAEFASAIRRKLLLEISGARNQARVIPAQNSPADGYDCLAGEKRWRWYLDRMPN